MQNVEAAIGEADPQPFGAPFGEMGLKVAASGDEAITRFLTSQGAAGVPLYLWYDPNREPQQLPQVLTPDMLVELAEGSEG